MRAYEYRVATIYLGTLSALQYIGVHGAVLGTLLVSTILMGWAEVNARRRQDIDWNSQIELL